MPQSILPLFPSDATAINKLLSFACRDGQVYYFHGTLPVFSHGENDKASFRMFTSQLYINGQCTQMEIVRAFGVTKISVLRAVEKFRKGGAEAFFVKKNPDRKPRVLTPTVITQAQALLDEGLSRSAVAEQLGLKGNTLCKAINSDRLSEKKRE